MSKISKNKRKKMRRAYNPQAYFNFLIDLFVNSNDDRYFVQEVNYSLLNSKRNLTSDLVVYAKSQDAQMGKELELALFAVIQGLAGEKQKTYYPDRRKGTGVKKQHEVLAEIANNWGK